MFAVLCSGQGGQHADMFSMVRRNPAANAVLTRAVDERWLGDDARAWLAAPVPDGPALHLDRLAQPLVCLYQQAVWAAARPGLPRVSAFAGLSLGELNACACAGAWDVQSLLAIAAERARLMDSAAATGELVAVVGLGEAAVAELCTATGAAVAICFGPQHWTLGCMAGDAGALISAATARGADRAAALQVTIASHTHWMDPAAQPFRDCLSRMPPARVAAPVLAGVSGRRLWSAGDLASALVAQLHTTVRWDLCMDGLLAGGCRVFLELGPGNALAHALLERDPTVDARSADDFPDLQHAAAWARAACARQQ